MLFFLFVVIFLFFCCLKESLSLSVELDMKNDDEKLNKKNPQKEKHKEFFYPLKKTCFVLPYEIFFSLYIFLLETQKKIFFLAQSLSRFLFFIRSGVSSFFFHLVRCFVCVCVYNFAVFSFFVIIIIFFVSCL
jgi:hypothetical protein